MRPSGNAIFFESLGHNPLINIYRNWTPEARTIDEHPLLKSDFDIIRKHFSKCDLQFFGLLRSHRSRSAEAFWAVRCGPSASKPTMCY